MQIFGLSPATCTPRYAFTGPLLKVAYTYAGAVGFAERGVDSKGSGRLAGARTNVGVFMEPSKEKKEVPVT